MKKCFFAFAFCLFFSFLCCENSKKIHIYAEVQASQIRLRWAMNNLLTWQLGNRYGYTLERYEIPNSAIATQPVRAGFTIFIKQADSVAWKDSFERHQSFAILSQALFGKEFQTSFRVYHPTFDSLYATQSGEQRFSLALLAADQCFEAACLAGLGWTDKNIDRNRTYFYRLYINAPDSLALCDTAKILIASSQFVTHPEITDVVSESGDKTAFLAWDIKKFQGIYNSYGIEKSTDKRHFEEITNTGTLNISEDASIAFFADRLENNEQTYYYRIFGTTIFGTRGKTSEIISVTGTPVFSEYPENLEVFEKDRRFVLQWTFDENSIFGLSHFLIFHQQGMDEEKKIFAKIQPKRLHYTFKASEMSNSNYFSVAAVYKNGQERYSHPCFFQFVDTVPPAQPRGLLGVSSSSGIVNLFWKKNTEKDLIGYRVFRSNRIDQEAMQVSKQLCLDTFFLDTISVNTTKSVYYQIVAIDKRGNESEFSTRTEVKRKNTFPPIPIFEDSVVKFSAEIGAPLEISKIKAFADLDNRKIILRFQVPNSILRIQLFRKKDQENWYLLDTFEPANGSYIDTNLEMNSIYWYRMRCVDSMGNYSPISEEVRIAY